MALTRDDLKKIEELINGNNILLLREMEKILATKDELKETEDRLSKRIMNAQGVVANLKKEFDTRFIICMEGRLKRQEVLLDQHSQQLKELGASGWLHFLQLKSTSIPLIYLLREN